MSKGNVRPVSADSRYSLEFQEFVIKHLALLLKMQTEMLQKMEEMNQQMVGMNQEMGEWTSGDFSQGESVIEEVRD